MSNSNHTATIPMDEYLELVQNNRDIEEVRREFKLCTKQILDYAFANLQDFSKVLLPYSFSTADFDVMISASNGKRNINWQRRLTNEQ